MPRTRLLAFAAASFTACIVVVAVVAVTWYIGGGGSGPDEARPGRGRRQRNDAERRQVAPHLANPSQDSADGSPDNGRGRRRQSRNNGERTSNSPQGPSSGPQPTREVNNLRQSTGESSSRRNLTVNSGLRNRRANESPTDGEGSTTRSTNPTEEISSTQSRATHLAPFAPEPNPWSAEAPSFSQIQASPLTVSEMHSSPTSKSNESATDMNKASPNTPKDTESTNVPDLDVVLLPSSTVTSMTADTLKVQKSTTEPAQTSSGTNVLKISDSSGDLPMATLAVESNSSASASMSTKVNEPSDQGIVKSIAFDDTELMKSTTEEWKSLQSEARFEESRMPEMSSSPSQSSITPEITRVKGPTTSTSNMSTERSSPLISEPGLNTGGSNVPGTPSPSYESLITVQPSSQEAKVFSLPASPFSESFSLVGGEEGGMQSFQSLSDAYAPQSSTRLESSRDEEQTTRNLSTDWSEPARNVDESKVSGVSPLVPPSTFEPLQPPSEDIGIVSLPTSPFSESFSLVSGGESGGEEEDITYPDSFRSFSEFGSESDFGLESVRDEVEEEDSVSVSVVSAVSAAGYRQSQGLAVGGDVLGDEDDVNGDGDDDEADRRTFIMQDSLSDSGSGGTGELDRTADTTLEDFSPSDYDSFSDSDSSVGGSGDGTSGGGDDEDNPQTSFSSSSSDSDESWGNVDVDYLHLESNDPLTGNHTPRSSLFSPFD